MTGYLDPYSLSFALYGAEKVHFAVPNRPGPEPAILGMSRGGDAVASPKHNTTLRAVAVLYAAGRESPLELQIFPNCNARIRLPLDAFSDYAFRQFEFDPSAPGKMPEWIERSPT